MPHRKRDPWGPKPIPFPRATSLPPCYGPEKRIDEDHTNCKDLLLARNNRGPTQAVVKGPARPRNPKEGSMTNIQVSRQYAALRVGERLRGVVASRRLDTLAELSTDLLGEVNPERTPPPRDRVKVVSVPSLDWALEVVGEHPEMPLPDELTVLYELKDTASQQEFRNLFHQRSIREIAPEQDAFAGIGADPRIALADHWCPGPENLAFFGRRADARRVLAVDALDAAAPPGDQPRVNVAIVDDGLNKDAIQAVNWGGGWRHKDIKPGTAPRTSHGMLVARNILDIAPHAVLYDVPLIPPDRIRKIPAFTVTADAALRFVLFSILFLRHFPRWSGPWVLVNAWGIFDRSSEQPFLGDYTENTSPGGHPLNNLVERAVSKHHIDVIFAAGNCGQFCPSGHCGALDRGPGHSIWGANSHAAVVTVGAVLTNEKWLGYSSQGPGQELLGRKKPDFCAPSHFCETTDAHVRNTGTSTACALTTGVIAALRSRWNQSRVTPADLKQVLIETVRRTHGPRWSQRFGHGVLNAEAALTRLSKDYPAVQAIAPPPTSW